MHYEINDRPLIEEDEQCRDYGKVIINANVDHLPQLPGLEDVALVNEDEDYTIYELNPDTEYFVSIGNNNEQSIVAVKESGSHGMEISLEANDQKLEKIMIESLTNPQDYCQFALTAVKQALITITELKRYMNQQEGND